MHEIKVPGKKRALKNQRGFNQFQKTPQTWKPTYGIKGFPYGI